MLSSVFRNCRTTEKICSARHRFESISELLINNNSNCWWVNWSRFCWSSFPHSHISAAVWKTSKKLLSKCSFQEVTDVFVFGTWKHQSVNQYAIPFTRFWVTVQMVFPDNHCFLQGEGFVSFSVFVSSRGFLLDVFAAQRAVQYLHFEYLRGPHAYV